MVDDLTKAESDSAPQEIPERRRVQRLRTLLTGILVFDETRSTMGCAVRNISAYGAKIVIADAFRLPEAFDLRIPHHDQVHRADVIWRKGDAAGVSLSEVQVIARRDRRNLTPQALKRAHQKELDSAQF